MGILVAALLALAAPQDQPIFRATADLWTVHVVALKGDKPVTGLQQQDFRLMVNGQERSISVFLPPESAPLEVGLALDVSESMGNLPLREVTQSLLDRLPGDTCVLLLPFNHRVFSGIWALAHDEWLRRGVAELRFQGGTALYDALIAGFGLLREHAATSGTIRPAPNAPGLEDLLVYRGVAARSRMREIPQPRGQCGGAARPPGTAAHPVRRVLVVVSDGHDEHSLATLEDALFSAWGSGIPMFSLGVQYGVEYDDPTASGGFQDWGGIRDSHVVRDLEMLTKYTGGISLRAAVFRKAGGGAVEDGFDRLVGALRGHYVLGFTSEQTRDPSAALIDVRDVEVSARRRGVKVLAQSDVRRGLGAQEGVAMDPLLRGFRQIATRPEAALTSFDAAITAAPTLGVGHYGRSLALSAMGRPRDALAALEVAMETAPWLPNLDARRAQLLADLGDMQSAAAAPSESPGRVRRVFLVATKTDDLLAQVAAPRILAALAAALKEHSGYMIAADENTSDLILELSAEKVKQGAAGPISFEGRVRLLQRTKTELSSAMLRVPDVVSQDSRRLAVHTLVEQLVRSVIDPS